MLIVDMPYFLSQLFSPALSDMRITLTIRVDSSVPSLESASKLFLFQISTHQRPFCSFDSVAAYVYWACLLLIPWQLSGHSFRASMVPGGLNSVKIVRIAT